MIIWDKNKRNNWNINIEKKRKHERENSTADIYLTWSSDPKRSENYNWLHGAWPSS